VWVQATEGRATTERRARTTLNDREQRMSSVDRVRQLRELVGRLELLPVTEERDSVLRQVRARAVDLDTGVTTRPVTARTRAAAVADPRATPSDAASAAPSRARRSRPARRSLSRLGEAVEVCRSSDVLAADLRLCLEELDVPDATASGARGAWTRGLRG
jgi:hypothetical protein